MIEVVLACILNCVSILAFVMSTQSTAASCVFNFQPHLVSVDKITLAAFEDSGWYRVNYELADNFVWGRGKLLYFKRYS